MREQHLWLRIGHHEGEALGWIIRIERQVGGAGLEDADEGDDHLGGALDAERHDGLGSGAERAQMVGELVGAGVELAVAEAFIVADQRDRVRGAGGLPGEQRRDGGGGDWARGVVPVCQDGAALGG